MSNSALRRQRARIGALSLHAKYDSKKLTANARKAFLSSFARQVDPEGKLAPQERERRAESAKRAHFQKLAYLSAKKRSANKAPRR